MSRPKSADPRRGCKRLPVPLYPHERAEIKALAAVWGCSEAGAVRRAVMEAVERQKG